MNHLEDLPIDAQSRRESRFENYRAAEKPNRVDLVLLGTDVRPGGRLFLGPSVERVLKHCRASVIVVNE